MSNELIADYNLLPEDANLQLLRCTLVVSGHVLAEDKTQLAGQLWGRLQSFAASEIQELLQQAHLNQTTWLRPLTSSLTRPDGNLIITLTGHLSSVNAIAFSVDGKYLISGSSDSTLQVWDWQTGVEVRTLTGHIKSVNAIAFSPNGKYLISGSSDSTLQVWDWQTGVEVRTLTGHTDRVYAIAFSPNGKYLISGSSDSTLQVWNWQTGEVIATFIGDSSIHCCAVAPDRLTIVAGEASGRVHFLQLEGA
ncbi:WD40 repeat domain-containing protein [Plectonema radiosum NIES-515]|uniref:WD40 repeat domain-containing protein n=1 Tax=Plectonema radiosum NIES-515 TaxID=2986073 RepID=A0ABT3B257_9CYAN|nr:WD40 repeat domain-containing protein [Plectonema radiosum]MCV3215459.1 WD40 repeat domain-containing protein [Plectonema radiosum NIES-515]